MSGSRVFLDLSAFFSGVRQQSCIFLDYEKNKTVKDVEDHIRRVFGVDRPFHILNDGWLLPPSESSLILRDNDTVSIVPEGEVKLSTKTTDKSRENVDTDSQEKSSKHNEVARPDSSLANGNGQIKLKEPANVDLPAPSSALTNRNGKESSMEKLTTCVKNPFASTNLSVVPNRTLSVSEPNNVTTGQMSTPASQELEFASESESGGRKRKRIRRRKKKPTDEIEREAKTEEKKQSPYIMNKYFQGVSHILKTALPEQNNKKHIFFNDQENNSKVKNAESAVNTVSDGEHHVSQKNSSADSLGDLSKLMSLGKQKSPAVFERKKSENLGAVEPKPDPPKKAATSSAYKLTPLSSLPVKETIIKFKILKMVNYSPAMSELITARVVSPDFTSNQLFVQITEGLSELQSEKGKFSLDEEGEEEEEQPPSEYMYLNWHDLLEPKAVEYC